MISRYIFDGAMGTYYSELTGDHTEKCELANLTDRKTILRIHREYISAGSDAIRTNTFSANKMVLGNDSALLRKIISAGWETAIEAVSGTTAEVFADIGPIQDAEPDLIYPMYKEICDIFISLGAKRFIFETQSREEGLAEIAEYIKTAVPDAYIIVQFAVSPEGYTRFGKAGNDLLDKMFACGAVDAAGFNCYCGPNHLLQLIKTMDTKGRTISVMPNSGYPHMVGERTLYEDSEKYFASVLKEISALGVSILGGCCGTKPSYIAALIRKPDTNSGISVKEHLSNKSIESVSVNENRFSEKLRNGKKVIIAELDPPVDTNIRYFLDGAKKYMELGLDAITIADCPVAKARADSSLLACKIKRELGLDVIPHLTCRDRNLNATKALLLGLNIEGINNILLVTGDPIPAQERDTLRGLQGFSAVMMAEYVRSLNEKVFHTPFNLCGALNINSKNFKAQLKYAEKKIGAGIRVFLTQPVLSDEAKYNLKEAKNSLDAKILAGIMPVVSYGNACFMNNEIPGITVSDEILEKYRDKDKEEAARLAISISTQIAEEIKDHTDGYYIITPFKRTDIAAEIISNIRFIT